MEKKNLERSSKTSKELNILMQNNIGFTPKVSVIIPVYNVENYLRECLDSVITQTLREIEIICVDDGSTDSSVEILKEYADNDNRITILTQQNSGSGKARNFGIKTAKGEFIAFMDSDDFYPTNKTLYNLYTVAKENNVSICGGSLNQLKDGKLITDPSKFEDGYTFKQNGLMEYKDYQFDYGYWRFIYSRVFLINNEIYFPDYLRQQDPPFFVNAMIIAKTFYALTEPTYVYRVSYKQMSWNERKAIDVVKALTDILTYTKIYNLDKLHYITAQKLVNPWFLRAFKLLTEKDESRSFLEKLVASLDYKIIYNFDTNFSLTRFYESLPNMCKVSIVIPVYNTELYLQKCLDSVINQTYRNIEIICVNDGSTDNSPEILAKYAEMDERVKIISQKNQGLPNARNTGLQHCSGDLIMFVDSDDWLDLNYIEVMSENLLKNDADVVKSGYKHYFSDDNIKDDAINEIINVRYNKNQSLRVWENNIVVWASLYKKSFLISKNIFMFDADILKHEDILYTIKATTLANKIIPVKDIYYHYRRSSSILSKFDKSVSNIYPIITERAIDFLNKNLFLDKEGYIKIAQRLVWRVLDAYNKLNEFEEFKKDVYISKLANIFAQIEYKINVFKPYLNIIKALNNKQLNDSLYKEINKILVVEMNCCHGECLPGNVKYLQELGYKVDVILNEKQEKESPLFMFSNVSTLYLSENDIINFLNSSALERYKICLFNSNIIYSKKNKSIFDLFNYKKSNVKFLCVEHRLENIPTLSHKAICIVLKKFTKTKLAYEVNPHYFGDIQQHIRNKVITFICVGNIDERRRNYSILIKGIEDLHLRNIKNFKVIIIGKGNILDIPENIRSYFDIKGRLSYQEMYKEMQNADYFLSLLDPTNKEHERYLKYGTSGSFQLIYGFKIPCIIADKFAYQHGFNEHNSIIYSENKYFSEALKIAIEQTETDYYKMQKQISIYSEFVHKNSLSNLKLALSSKISKKNKLLAYLMFPYNLIKLHKLKKRLPKKTILLSGYFSEANFGDVLYGHLFYDKCKSLGFDKINFLQFKNCGIGEDCRKEFNYTKKKSFLSLLRAKAYVIVSGGSFWDEKNRNEAFIRYFRFVFVGRLFQLLGKPVYVLGVGGGPVETNWLRKSMVKLLNKAKIVYFRDDETKKVFEKYGVKNKMTVTADTALIVTPNNIHEFTQKYDLDKGAKGRKKFLLHIPDGGDGCKKVLDIIVPSVINFLKKHSEYYLIISNDGIRKNITAYEKRLRNEIYKAFENKKIDFYDYKYHDCKQMCALINECDTITTSKLHVGVVGCSLGKSVIAFPVHREKTDNFYKMINHSDRCINIKNLNSEMVYNQLDRYHKIPIMIDENIRSEAQKNLDALSDVLNDN